MSHVLVLTGMHRSATSLIASMFQRAGVQLGTELLEPHPHNPRGYFEDVEFLEFQRELLHARGKSIFVDRAFSFAPTQQENARADALLAARASHKWWGWKDPRTSLFLDFWRAKIPNAHFLFIYRHPWDVLLSLVRRHEWYWRGLLEGLEAWYVYNRALIEFHAQYPEQTLLCNCYTVVDEIELFNVCLRDKFQLALNLDMVARDSQYQPSELQRAELSDAAEQILQKIHPDACALYARMNRLADMPAREIPAFPSTPELDALAQYAAMVEETNGGARRGLLFALLGATEPDLLEQHIGAATVNAEQMQIERDNVWARETIAAQAVEIETQKRALATRGVRAVRGLEKWIEPQTRNKSSD